MAFQTMQHHKPIIETERCILRLFEESDISCLHSLYVDEEAMQFLPGTYSREVTERHVRAFADLFEERGFTLWALESKAGGEFLGRVGLWPLKGTDEIELGYVVARAYWNQGFATEASAACLTFAFQQLDLPFVAAISVPENAASLQVMKKLGFQFVREDRFYNTDVLYHRLPKEAAAGNDLFSSQGRS